MTKDSPNHKLLARAISDCYSLIKAYVEGSVSLSEFRCKMIEVITPFCDINSRAGEVKEADWKSLLEFKDLVFDKGGDKFEPSTDPFPHHPDWVYGESQEEYGWVDQEAFKSMLRKRFFGEETLARMKEST